VTTAPEKDGSIAPIRSKTAWRWLPRFLRRNPSLLGMPALMVFALLVTVAIHPQFGAFDIQSLALGALPLAFAAAAQTAVVL
jgi:ribose transport system permease protein